MRSSLAAGSIPASGLSIDGARTSSQRPGVICVGHHQFFRALHSRGTCTVSSRRSITGGAPSPSWSVGVRVLPASTIFSGLGRVVRQQPSKLFTRVRFPQPAPFSAPVAQLDRARCSSRSHPGCLHSDRPETSLPAQRRVYTRQFRD